MFSNILVNCLVSFQNVHITWNVHNLRVWNQKILLYSTLLSFFFYKNKLVTIEMFKTPCWVLGFLSLTALLDSSSSRKRSMFRNSSNVLCGKQN